MDLFVDRSGQARKTCAAEMGKLKHACQSPPSSFFYSPLCEFPKALTFMLMTVFSERPTADIEAHILGFTPRCQIKPLKVGLEEPSITMAHGFIFTRAQNFFSRSVSLSRLEAFSCPKYIFAADYVNSISLKLANLEISKTRILVETAVIFP